MSRTTVAIDPPILKELREIAQNENKPLRQVIDEVLSAGLREKKSMKHGKIPRLKWKSQKMGARIDYLDKDELYRALDESK